MRYDIIKEMKDWYMDIPVVADAEGNNFVEVRAYYSLGGMNYFTGVNEPRGYYLSFQPLSISTASSGFVCKSFRGFSGEKSLIEAASRFGRSKADKVFVSVFADTEMIKGWLASHGFVTREA